MWLGVSAWEWIFLGICIVVILYYIFCYFTAPNIERYLKSLDSSNRPEELETIINEIENGDILLLSGDTSGERTCRYFAGSCFSHVGLLFREIHPHTNEDIVYILESDIGQGGKDGVRVMTLLDKLERYQGFRVGAIKKLVNKNPPLKDIVSLIGKYEHVDFDHKMATWWTADIKPLYNLFKSPDKMFCSEFLAAALQELNILRKDRHPAWYHPGNFHRNTLSFEDGYSYGETRFFDFSIDSVKELQNIYSPIETGFEISMNRTSKQ